MVLKLEGGLFSFAVRRDDNGPADLVSVGHKSAPAISDAARVIFLFVEDLDLIGIGCWRRWGHAGAIVLSAAHALAIESEDVVRVVGVDEVVVAEAATGYAKILVVDQVPARPVAYKGRFHSTITQKRSSCLANPMRSKSASRSLGLARL